MRTLDSDAWKEIELQAACCHLFPCPVSYLSSRVTTALPVTAALPLPPPAPPSQKTTKYRQSVKPGRSFSLEDLIAMPALKRGA